MFFRSTARNFGPGRVETVVNKDTIATPDEIMQEQDSGSSNDEILLSQLPGKSVQLLIAIES